MNSVFPSRCAIKVWTSRRMGDRKEMLGGTRPIDQEDGCRQTATPPCKASSTMATGDGSRQRLGCDNVQPNAMAWSRV